MTRQEIFEAMIHNAKAMVSMGTANGDMEMALVGHATLTALAAIQNGDGGEFSLTIVAFHELMEAKREREREHAEMPEAMESMLNEMGIVTNQ
jgi:hypothetical protein